MAAIGFDQTKKCVQGTPAQCVCACAVNFNVKEFLRKVRAGDANASYRLLANAMVFPEITVRICDGSCQNACCSHLDLLKIEQMVVREATKTEPKNYTVPPKKPRIAVIGAGLSGLACAARLGARKYDVTIYEASESIGGTLSEYMPEDEYVALIEKQMQFCRYEMKTGTPVSSLDSMDYDAYYVATGSGGEDFGLLDSWDSQCMATERDSVFMGGRITGASQMEALAHGFVAASSIEKYVQVKSMTGQPGSFITKECLIPFVPPVSPDPVIPENDGLFSKEEAVREAERCTNCDCTVCMDSCEFMKYYKMFPRDVEQNAEQSMNTMIGLQDRVGSRQIFSCSATGHCGSICPQGISCEDISLRAKRTLFQQGSYPETLHDFYLRDMAAAMGDDFLFRCPPGHDHASFMLFAGCSTGESSPEYVRKAYSLMTQYDPDTGIVMACCGVPALWWGNYELFEEIREQLITNWEKCGKPVFVVMCPTCLKTLTQHFPEIPVISFYEYADEHDLPVSTKGKDGSFAVFDACSSREFPGMQNAVRNILKKGAVTIEELPENSMDKARCCGMGGHIYPANRELAVRMVHYSASLSDVPYIAYCTNCRDLFLTSGKRCLHVMDIIGGFEEKEKVQHIARLRRNRRQLKADLLKEVWGEDTVVTYKELMMLQIPEEILNKMDREMISEDEVREVIYYCEKTDDKLYNEETGTFTGHKKIGNITYWVEYKSVPDHHLRSDYLFRVCNAYYHRVMIEDE